MIKFISIHLNQIEKLIKRYIKKNKKSVSVEDIEVLSNILVDAKGITKRLNLSYQLFMRKK